MRDADLERTVRSIKKRKRSSAESSRAREHRRRVRANPHAKCVQCQSKARHTCEGCYRYLCDGCAIRVGSKRFCSERCVRDTQHLHTAMEAGHKSNRARDLRMWLADPWDLGLYGRGFKVAVVIACLLALWGSMNLLTRSRSHRDIRDRGIAHGVNLPVVPVGTPEK